MGNDQPTSKPGAEVNTLLIEDQVLSHGFIQLPKLVLYATNVARDAKLLYAELLGCIMHSVKLHTTNTHLSRDRDCNTSRESSLH